MSSITFCAPASSDMPNPGWNISTRLLESFGFRQTKCCSSTTMTETSSQQESRDYSPKDSISTMAWTLCEVSWNGMA